MAPSSPIELARIVLAVVGTVSNFTIVELYSDAGDDEATTTRRSTISSDLDINQLLREGRAFLDKGEAGFRLVAHQTLDR